MSQAKLAAQGSLEFLWTSDVIHCIISACRIYSTAFYSLIISSFPAPASRRTFHITEEHKWAKYTYLYLYTHTDSNPNSSAIWLFSRTFAEIEFWMRGKGAAASPDQQGQDNCRIPPVPSVLLGKVWTHHEPEQGPTTCRPPLTSREATQEDWQEKRKVSISATLHQDDKKQSALGYRELVKQPIHSLCSNPFWATSAEQLIRRAIFLKIGCKNVSPRAKENNLLPLSKETSSWRRSFLRIASIHDRVVVALNGAGALQGTVLPHWALQWENKPTAPLLCWLENNNNKKK